MKVKTCFAIAFLLVAMCAYALPVQLVSAELEPPQVSQTQVFGNTEVPEMASVNWTRFWQLFNARAGDRICGGLYSAEG